MLWLLLIAKPFPGRSFIFQNYTSQLFVLAPQKSLLSPEEKVSLSVKVYVSAKSYKSHEKRIKLWLKIPFFQYKLAWKISQRLARNIQRFHAVKGCLEQRSLTWQSSCEYLANIPGFCNKQRWKCLLEKSPVVSPF